MWTYLLLNNLVLAVVLVATWRYRRMLMRRSVWLSMAVLLVTTAVFDSLIIGAGIVAYDASLLSGVYVGLAPIEDFYYALVAAILLPVLWHALDNNKEQHD